MTAASTDSHHSRSKSCRGASRVRRLPLTPRAAGDGHSAHARNPDLDLRQEQLHAAEPTVSIVTQACCASLGQKGSGNQACRTPGHTGTQAHLEGAKEDDHVVVGVGALRPAWVRSSGVQAVAALYRPAAPSVSAASRIGSAQTRLSPVTEAGLDASRA